MVISISSKLEEKLELDYTKAIELLAQETGRPIEDVSLTFTSVFTGLKSSARIHDYLVVLTSKIVRDTLRQS